jgi:hypothetical protein
VSGDIVERLRCEQPPRGCMCQNCEAADEIERLRAAGDALAEVALIAVIHCRDHEVEQCNRAYAAWQEARRDR